MPAAECHLQRVTRLWRGLDLFLKDNLNFEEKK